MIRLLITNYDEKQELVSVVAVDDNYKIAPLYQGLLQTFVASLPQTKAEPWNFSIEKGKLVQDAGKLNRLGVANQVTLIVLDEMVTKSDRIVGYIVYNTVTNSIIKISKQDLIAQAEQVSKQYPLIQNGIVAHNAVRSYAGHPFGAVVMQQEKQNKVYSKKIVIDADEAAWIEKLLTTEPKDEASSFDPEDTFSFTAKFNDGCEMDIKVCGVDYEESFDSNLPFTEAVLFNSKGAELCCTEPSDDFFGEWELEYNGTTYKVDVVKGASSKPKVHPDFKQTVPQDDYTAEQKKILQEGEKKGVPVEYFSDPAIPADVLQFYVKHIYNEQVAEDCRPLFEHPELPVGRVDTLYKKALQGVDIEDYCDATIPADELEQNLNREYRELWCDIDRTTEEDAALLLKCIQWADREKAEGYL